MTRIDHLNEPHAPQALEAYTNKKDVAIYVATPTTASEKRQHSANNEARREVRRGH